MNDAFDRLVELRPPVPDEHGWGESADGRAVLARVHAEGARRPSWWTRRRFVVPTILLGLGGAVASGVAFAPAGRAPDASVPVVCVDRTSDGALALRVTGLESDASRAVIVAACNAQYSAAGRVHPVDFALCIIPVSRGEMGGALAAVPSTAVVTTANAAGICQAAGYAPHR